MLQPASCGYGVIMKGFIGSPGVLSLRSQKLTSCHTRSCFAPGLLPAIVSPHGLPCLSSRALLRMGSAAREVDTVKTQLACMYVLFLYVPSYIRLGTDVCSFFAGLYCRDAHKASHERPATLENGGARLKL